MPVAERAAKGSMANGQVIEALCRNRDLGLNKCCRQYNIPKPTLKRHLHSRNVIANEDVRSLSRLTDVYKRQAPNNRS